MGRRKVEIDTAVITMLKKGFTNEMITKKLGVSLRTIKNRRQSIMKRYKAKSAVQLGYLIGKKEMNHVGFK